MKRRPSSLFRGSELPRLLFLVAIVLAGWPMIILFARPRADEKPPPPALQAKGLTPIVADDGIEFQALIDKAPIQTRESTAYATLLERARETTPAQLAAKSRRDLLYTHLWERPKLYRGVPVHLEGTAKRVLTYEVSEAMSPKKRLYEAWITSDETRAFPYVVMFEEPPTGLVIGPDLNLRVSVDAYFMKLLGYHAGDHLRAAPMLVGRLQWIPAAPEAAAPMVELRNWSKRDGFVVLLVLLVGYIALRAFFQIRKAIAPSRSLGSRLSEPMEGLPEEQVSDWLQQIPDEPEEGSFPLRDRPGPRDL